MNEKKIEEHVQNILHRMGFMTVAIRSHLVTPQMYIHIEAGPDGKLLIGPSGAHLAALQYIIRSVTRRELDPAIRILVDVNGYRARREQDLVIVAEAAATQALQQGQPVILTPMSSADRRAIHTALAGRTDIVTASHGEEPQRSVVVRPVSL